MEGRERAMWLVRGIGILAALVFVLSSGAINYLFMSGLGQSPLEAHIFGSVSAAGDALKAMLPFLVAVAIARGQWVYAGIASTFFMIFMVFSLVSAIGFAAGNRGAVTGGKEALTARFKLADVELKEVESQLASLGQVGAAAQLGKRIESLKLHRRWRSTSGCVDVTATKSRLYCKSYFKLQGQMVSAVKAARLRERQSELRKEWKTLRANGAGQEADPQASALAKILSLITSKVDVDGVQLWLVVLLAVVVELGASFGLYLATGLDVRHAKAEKKPRKKPAKARAETVVRPARKALPVVQLEHVTPEVVKPERFSLGGAGQLLIDAKAG